ncbi:hypothetical protein CC56_1315 [Bordetella pertussis H934]|nr:hypothetical protein CC56_1315 [Bordetella pertussis H934]
MASNEGGQGARGRAPLRGRRGGLAARFSSAEPATGGS